MPFNISMCGQIYIKKMCDMVYNCMNNLLFVQTSQDYFNLNKRPSASVSWNKDYKFGQRSNLAKFDQTYTWKYKYL
jgi:hypothetical protein